MASVPTLSNTKKQENVQMITRSAIKLKRNTLRVPKKEDATAKNQVNESETEDHKLRTDIEERDRTIGQLQQERDQLQIENDLLKKRLEEHDINFTDQSRKFVNIEVVGKRKHRALPPTPLPFSATETTQPSPDETLIVKKPKQSPTADYATIVRKAVQDGVREETFQLRERKRRANNIVIHGMKENASIEDKLLLQKLMETIGVTTSPRSFIRLGRNTTTTTIRPIKIVMANATEKRSFMKALPKLKNDVVYSRLRITDDLTINDRKTITLWLTEARKRNEKEPGNCTWTLRGSPLTQLRLVKIERTKNTQKTATTTPTITTTKAKNKTR